MQDLLDSAATSPDHLSSLKRADLVEQLQCLQSCVSADNHSEARNRIYLWKMLLRDDLSDELDEPELILQPAGDAVIDDITVYCRLDISHQPEGLTSWERLAGLHVTSLTGLHTTCTRHFLTIESCHRLLVDWMVPNPC